MREGGNLKFGGMISQPPRLTTCITLESFPVYNRKDLSDEEPLLKQTGFICDQNLEVTMILSSVNILYLSSSIEFPHLDTGNENGTEMQGQNLNKSIHLPLNPFRRSRNRTGFLLQKKRG